MSFHFNIDKVVQAAAAFVRSLEERQISYMKLIKLLYIADRESLRETGAPLTGDTYVAMKHGPVLSRVYDLIMDRHPIGQEVWDRYFKTDVVTLKLLEDPGADRLSRYEVSKLQEINDKYRPMNQWDLCEMTHEFEEWVRNNPGDSSKKIGLSHILEAVGRKDDLDDIIQDAEDSETFSEIFGD